MNQKAFLLWVCLCMAQCVLGQEHRPLQRKIEQGKAGEFTISYSFLSDSLKGFFLITEHISGKTKLLKASCKNPYRFVNNRLQVSGDKIATSFKADFTFKILEGEAAVHGTFRSENFGSESLEMAFEEIKLEGEPQLTASIKPEINNQKSQNTVENGHETEARKQPVINNHHNHTSTTNETSSTRQLGTGSREPDTVHTISFRVQLAASTTPMDMTRLGQLSGLQLTVYEDRIDNYFKYTIGNETNLKAAQDLLNRVAKNNFKKPFIVAYRDKNRITVQQALDEINRMNEGAVYRK